MELKDQVCSLELAQKLKELGVKQESLFAWYGVKWRTPEAENVNPSWELNRVGYLEVRDMHWISDQCSAYTVAELGEMLPRRINIPFKNGKPRKVWNTLKSYFGAGSGCEVIYAKPLGSNEYLWQRSETEADARAKMLIYLAENKLITL